MTRYINRLAGVAVLLATGAGASAQGPGPRQVSAQNPPPVVEMGQPPDATPAPLLVSAEDQQAIANAMDAVRAYELAIAVLREKADAAAFAGQRAWSAAEAKQPGHTIDSRTWTYVPKAGGQQ